MPFPEQAPPQAAKTEPGAAAAVRVMGAFIGNCTVQSTLQFSPAGLLTTLPLPVPSNTSWTANDERAKVAVTL